MNRRAIWISALAALLGAALLWLYMRRFEQEASGGARTRVLVLTRDARRGSLIERELLAERALPEAYLDSRHVGARDTDQVLGARLGVDAHAGEALLWTDLGSLREPGRPLSSLIPEGMRAIALDLRGAGIEELLDAGDRVDVLLSVRGAPGAPTEHADRAGAGLPIIAHNVLVLAVGDDTGGSHARRSARNTHSVSLGVTPEQATRLAEAEQTGALRLLLRNPDEIDFSSTGAAPRTTSAP